MTELVSQLRFIGCKELDPKDGVDCGALVNRHDFERLLQSLEGAIFLQSVGLYKMENESLDPFLAATSSKVKQTGRNFEQID